MTVIVDGTDIGPAIEIALLVVSILVMVLGAFLVWLMVRPPRHVREARRRGPEVREADGIELEEMMRLLDRMDQRLAVLERAIGTEDEAPRRMAGPQGDEFLNLGAESPEARRTK